MSKFAVAKLAIHHCSNQHLLDPKLLDSLTKAEQIIYCLNNELATFVYPAKSTVLIDDH